MVKSIIAIYFLLFPLSLSQPQALDLWDRDRLLLILEHDIRQFDALIHDERILALLSDQALIEGVLATDRTARFDQAADYFSRFSGLHQEIATFSLVSREQKIVLSLPSAGELRGYWTPGQLQQIVADGVAQVGRPVRDTQTGINVLPLLLAVVDQGEIAGFASMGLRLSHILNRQILYDAAEISSLAAE